MGSESGGRLTRLCVKSGALLRSVADSGLSSEAGKLMPSPSKEEWRLAGGKSYGRKNMIFQNYYQDVFIEFGESDKCSMLEFVIYFLKEQLIGRHEHVHGMVSNLVLVK